jgi:hypothetical protein
MGVVLMTIKTVWFGGSMGREQPGVSERVSKTEK